MVHQGCTFSNGTQYFSHLPSQPRCVKMTSVQLSNDVVDDVVLLSTEDSYFTPCQNWTENSPCKKKVLGLSSQDDLSTSSLSLEPELCEGEEGVNIQLMEVTDLLTPTNVYLYYKALPNQAIELKQSKRCFRVKKNLCGPNSISFLSNKKNLFLTNCQGSLLMRTEEKHCG